MVGCSLCNTIRCGYSYLDHTLSTIGQRNREHTPDQTHWIRVVPHFLALPVDAWFLSAFHGGGLPHGCVDQHRGGIYPTQETCLVLLLDLMLSSARDTSVQFLLWTSRCRISWFDSNLQQLMFLRQRTISRCHFLVLRVAF